MFGGDDLEEGPRGTFETYKAEGDTLFKNGEYKKAIESYGTALDLQQDDKNCLVARSRCYLQLGDTDAALKDSEASLKEDPNFHKGLFQKAEALYYRGEFELALVFYHRGHKLKPVLQEFRLGIQKAQEAIDNSVGSPEKVKLTKEGDLSYFEKQTTKVKKARKGARKHAPGQKEGPKTNASPKTVKQLLGELYGDKVYLEKLLKETDAKTKIGSEIYDLANDGLRYLDTRADFWRQQKPMYARKRDRLMQRKPKETTDPNTANKLIVKELEKIDQEQLEGKHVESLKRVKKCMKTILAYPEDVLDNKSYIISSLQSYLGNAHLELGEIDKAIEHHQTDLDISIKIGNTLGKSRAIDNLGRAYARGGHFQKAIDVWSQKLPTVTVAQEKAWLCHEIGRCHMELNNIWDSRVFGEKALTAAMEANDEQWGLNASVLMAQADVKLDDFEDALVSFDRALKMARIHDNESAEKAIKKAMAGVKTKIAQKKLNAMGSEENSDDLFNMVVVSGPSPELGDF